MYTKAISFKRQIDYLQHSIATYTKELEQKAVNAKTQNRKDKYRKAAQLATAAGMELGISSQKINAVAELKLFPEL